MTEFSHKPGHVLAVDKGLFRHKGIATGEGTVVTTTPECGITEQWECEFAKGNPIQDCGYRSKLPSAIVVANARSQIGRPYSLWTNNCDHLVQEAHGLKRESPQLQGWLFVGLLVVSAAMILRKARA